MASNDSYMPQSVDPGALLDRAQRYCAGAEHCPADVAQLLARYGATREQTDKVIGILVQQGYLDSARYCRAFVHDKVAFQAWGRTKIAMGLRAKHLPETCIQEALQEIDADQYADNIRKLLQSKRGQDKPRIVRFMLQRGFTFDDLRRYTDDTNYDDYENDN